MIQNGTRTARSQQRNLGLGDCHFQCDYLFIFLLCSCFDRLIELNAFSVYTIRRQFIFNEVFMRRVRVHTHTGPPARARARQRGCPSALAYAFNKNAHCAQGSATVSRNALYSRAQNARVDDDWPHCRAESAASLKQQSCFEMKHIFSRSEYTIVAVGSKLQSLHSSRRFLHFGNITSPVESNCCRPAHPMCQHLFRVPLDFVFIVTSWLLFLLSSSSHARLSHLPVVFLCVQHIFPRRWSR